MVLPGRLDACVAVRSAIASCVSLEEVRDLCIGGGLALLVSLSLTQANKIHSRFCTLRYSRHSRDYFVK